MIEEYKTLLDIKVHDRKEWFMEAFDDVEEVMEAISPDGYNDEWVGKFANDTDARPELSHLQKTVSRINTFKKAVVDEYIAEGDYLLNGIDFYRYGEEHKELVSKALEDGIKQL